MAVPAAESRDGSPSAIGLADFLLTKREDGSWFVSGIIDFGDARIGHPFYDFIAVLADYTLGEPELSYQLLAAYGLESSPEVEKGLLSFCLLHEFGRLQDFLDAHPMEGPTDLRRALWGTDVRLGDLPHRMS